MNTTESTLFYAYVENEKDTDEFLTFDHELMDSLDGKFSKSFINRIDDLIGDALHAEKRNAFFAGLKAGIEICASAMKGGDLCE